MGEGFTGEDTQPTGLRVVLVISTHIVIREDILIQFIAIFIEIDDITGNAVLDVVEIGLVNAPHVELHFREVAVLGADVLAVRQGITVVRTRVPWTLDVGPLDITCLGNAFRVESGDILLCLATALLAFKEVGAISEDAGGYPGIQLEAPPGVGGFKHRDLVIERDEVSIPGTVIQFYGCRMAI